MPTSVFRPSLACDASMEDFERILGQGDVLFASTKLDGIRAVVLNGQLVSRTLKPIRNRYIQSILGRPEYEGLDGELIVGSPKGEGVFARTSSGVMSEAGEPDFVYHVFDSHTSNKHTRHSRYIDRLDSLIFESTIWQPQHQQFMRLLPQITVDSIKTLEELESRFVEEGYEGVIARWTEAPYKLGRSTLRERYMLKLKRFADSEAKILGFQERMKNENEATIDARGFQVRGSSKLNKVGQDTLGAFIVQDIHKPEWEFSVGSGLDDALRQKIWDNQDTYLGQTLKYKYLPVGTIDRPRHPIFLGFRDKADM